MKTLAQEIKQKLLAGVLDGRYSPGKPMPTIRELAKTFGVGTKTVQRAVDELSSSGVVVGRPGKGLFVKSAVLQAKTSRQIAAVLPYERREAEDRRDYPGSVLAALETVLSESGYSLVVCPLPELNELAITESLRGLGLAGIALLEVDSDRLVWEIQELQLPLVSLDCDAYRLGVSSVVFDNVWGGYAGTTALIERGHRDIAALWPLIARRVGRNAIIDAAETERLEGYRVAMKGAGLPVRLEPHPSGREPLRNKLVEVFGCRPAPTALLCPNEPYAGGVVSELGRMGLRVPEDVSLMVFGSDRFEYSAGRKVASVWMDCEGMGRVGGQCLLATMREPARHPEKHVLPTKVITNDSIAELALARQAGIADGR